MVKKLYKHEFLAWLRVMAIVYIVTLSVAAIHRLIQLLENDTVYYGLINGSAIFVYIVALIACMAAPVLFGISRFYRNFFTGEGYLTFSLPASQASHLWVKVSTAVAFSILSVLTCLLSVVIITSGEVLSEICKAADYLFRMIPKDVSGHLVGYCVEFLLAMLLGCLGTHLLYETCICIGQLFRKNRVLAAVGVYFGFYIVSQIISTVLGVVLVVLEESGALDSVYLFMEKHMLETIHIVLSGSCLLNLLLAGAFWLICHKILCKKLNLE